MQHRHVRCDHESVPALSAAPAGRIPAHVVRPNGQDKSGEASSENDLGRNSMLKFLHGQSDVSRLAVRLQAPAAAVQGIRWRGWRVPRRGCSTDGRGAPSHNGSDAQEVDGELPKSPAAFAGKKTQRLAGERG